MATTIKKVIEGFELLFSSFNRKDFNKSLALQHWEEKELLPIVRAFLLGYFGKKMVPEFSVNLPGAPSGIGRIDFLIDDVAVEFAVRTPNSPACKISPETNKTEIKKLLKYTGKSVLVLFDFSKSPYSEKDLDDFKCCPLGKGNHKKSPFTVAYFHITKLDNKNYRLIKKQIKTC